MKKLEFKPEHFVSGRQYQPLDSVISAQKAQKTFDSWYSELEKEEAHKVLKEKKSWIKKIFKILK